jgi:imidazole glycerol-phosphate synthase subunit HisF
MLKLRVIPTLLWKEHGLVKGIGFNSWRRVGTILPAIRVYDKREVDELIVVDISATVENREPDYDMVKEFSSNFFAPLTIGGGIKQVEHVQKLLQAGADKVAINSALIENPELIVNASNRFGVQCIVASIDYTVRDGVAKCMIHSGKKATEYHPVELARKAEALGAGEILLTSIELDGTMNGYDLQIAKQIVKSVNIPVIISGGAGNYEHFRQAIVEAGASAVAAASMFHFTEQTPKDAKYYLKRHGIPVR